MTPSPFVAQPTSLLYRSDYLDSMIMLELFLTPHCVSAPSAIAVAKEAVKSVPDVELRIRSEKDYARAKSLGVFIFPSFVLDDEFIAIGEPKLEWLIGVLREKLKQKKRREMWQR